MSVLKYDYKEVLMGKLKHKVLKSHLKPEEKKLGRLHIYVLIAMIVVSIAIALYHMN